MKIKMYCITINENHYDKIRKLGYIPVGLGDKIKSNNFLSDKTGKNISSKNPFFGEYTFHYWLWKNNIEANSNNIWVGFCQYRKFFVKKIISTKNLSLDDLKDALIYEVNDQNNNFDSLLGCKFSVQNYKLSKILKHHFFHFFT